MPQPEPATPTLAGGAGADHLHGSAGDDIASGGQGADWLYGAEGDDQLHGGADEDHLYGEGGNDRIFGGQGGDWLYGGQGQDTLSGEAGDDHLYGEGGDDWLYGGEGNDEIHGGLGDDRLWGGTGNDFLAGHQGDDHLIGGAGSDTYIWGRAQGSDTIEEDSSAATAQDIDTVRLQHIASTANWKLTRQGQDLILGFEGQTLTLRGQLAAGGHAIEQVRFADGVTLSAAQLAQRLEQSERQNRKNGSLTAARQAAAPDVLIRSASAAPAIRPGIIEPGQTPQQASSPFGQEGALIHNHKGPWAEGELIHNHKGPWAEADALVQAMSEFGQQAQDTPLAAAPSLMRSAAPATGFVEGAFIHNHKGPWAEDELIHNHKGPWAEDELIHNHKGPWAEADALVQAMSEFGQQAQDTPLAAAPSLMRSAAPAKGFVEGALIHNHKGPWAEGELIHNHKGPWAEGELIHSHKGPWAEADALAQAMSEFGQEGGQQAGGAPQPAAYVPSAWARRMLMAEDFSATAQAQRLAGALASFAPPAAASAQTSPASLEAQPGGFRPLLAASA